MDSALNADKTREVISRYYLANAIEFRSGVKSYGNQGCP
ncbi:hypothetical protein C499_07315 [Halogeometricum borinquense DSM 11551]|uniref:Uncharacterized protein n=1 Tax=Halogeometricum borinquense (strain ATCC 700274 / DSM 11551 / JCM 10706 / KCTC 4070 / PR3) TaxID=469382 RepID=E4NVG6_HALBP|nr:hypothetical protein Hbor_33250 [Halogeometricum borinquense DSM 11551]ELY28721.1 hypothetical protein C499_07315 [Halogeometricum borinquense DSM 11551]